MSIIEPNRRGVLGLKLDIEDKGFRSVIYFICMVIAVIAGILGMITEGVKQNYNLIVVLTMGFIVLFLCIVSLNVRVKQLQEWFLSFSLHSIFM